MAKQDYSNHTRFYYPHHFVFYPLMLALIALCGYFIVHYPDRQAEWIMITVLCIIISWVAFMMRQHYALTLQNRIVLLELRLRYYQLTQQPFAPLEQQLTFGQLAALRFAPDEELVGLISQALKQNLTPDAIKKSIRNWLPDERRV